MAVIIRPMHLPDLQTAVAWAAEEGWNPGLHDAASFWATDPRGFFVGELDGQPISCISAVAYDDTFGFIGFYIVHPQWRGQGYGWQTWQHAMNYLGDRTIGLDGVVAQQDNYRKSGFSLAYRNIRYQGEFPQIHQTSEAVMPASVLPFEQLLAFDAQFFPVPRPVFLKAWIQQQGSVGLVKQVSDRILGYGVIRPCQVGWKIGPLFALDAATAEQLFRSLVTYAQGATCFLDVPELNPAALHLAKTYQMTPMFETARMYTNACPTSAISGIFGVTTFELG
ncbi:GCN5 family acetyltransferase [Neosynechococcus sphagnicola sy1]|uniref:GCN5 family acetyltransferase n=1 Tax=Neosynechococcus sphagnicola sy1 TaxID=1497020 RepID=A0A098TJ23_9CYAN|nr:GNAT family N-acetyltransferase [Neosynechococcus sphagnicola]KGF72051.1 GCN5 family acetyltransferase [Neosynechococcus sphagnicola sy1]